MTDLAVTATAATASPRGASRRSGASGEGSSPFAALLEARDVQDTAAADRRDRIREAEPASKAKAGEAASNEDEQDEKSAEPAKAGDGASPLPPWLLALRNPPAEAPTPAAPAFDPATTPTTATDPAATLAGFVRGAGSASGGKITGTQPTPPTQAPKDLPASALATTRDEFADTAAASSSLTAAFGNEAAATATDAALNPSQSAALTAALDKLAVQITPGTRADGNAAVATDALPGLAATPTSTPAATIPVPATPATPPTPEAAGAALLNAFGEPLALNQSDAATRLGERLRWLKEAGVQEARMQLHPRELGSVDIRIRIEGQNANVWFGAEHPGARAALEAALPQLRERFAADGLALSQAQVGGRDFASNAHAGGQANGQPGHGSAGASNSASARERDARASGVDALSLDPATIRDAVTRRQTGLVDRYV